MGAVRTSRRDKWDPSKAVSRYYTWRDELRLSLGISRGREFTDCREVHITAHFGTNIDSIWDLPHLERPDSDNIYKAVTDALFREDCGIWFQSCRKIWGPTDLIDITFKGLLR